MNNEVIPFFNIPDFLYAIHNPSKLNIFKKIILLIYGKIVQIFYKNTKEKTFCFFMNLLIRKNSGINFKDGFYFKNLISGLSIYYPNKRITRIISSEENLFNLLFETYCLNLIEFSDDDVVVDCGANVGELNYSFFYQGYKLKYIGIEPDPIVYNSLIKNIISGKEQFFDCALSDEIKTQKLFLATESADTSLEYAGQEKYEIIKTTTLDSLDLPRKIKLFKVEAEGHEPEVILGSLKTLKKIEFVSVDFGFERGLKAESTIVEVNKLLVENNFELIALSDIRLIGLYKNINI
ncbi:FkbM family methyltransferase [Candidatus Actinomarina]|nr:FkbM family methyltransferase [Candidatus Actinomarina sp.]